MFIKPGPTWLEMSSKNGRFAHLNSRKNDNLALNRRESWTDIAERKVL